MISLVYELRLANYILYSPKIDYKKDVTVISRVRNPSTNQPKSAYGCIKIKVTRFDVVSFYCYGG